MRRRLGIQGLLLSAVLRVRQIRSVTTLGEAPKRDLHNGYRLRSGRGKNRSFRRALIGPGGQSVEAHRLVDFGLNRPTESPRCVVYTLLLAKSPCQQQPINFHRIQLFRDTRVGPHPAIRPTRWPRG